MFFPKFVYMTKNTPFFLILHVFAPLNYVRVYSAWSWKTTLITLIFGRAWYPLNIRVAPWGVGIIKLFGYIFTPLVDHVFDRKNARIFTKEPVQGGVWIFFLIMVAQRIIIFFFKGGSLHSTCEWTLPDSTLMM